MAINHSAPLPNTYIQSHTGRYHQPIPVHHARYHLFMFYGRIVDPFFIRVQSLLLSLQALCSVLSARGLMVDVGPLHTCNWCTDRSPHLPLMLSHCLFINVYFGKPHFKQMTPFDFDGFFILRNQIFSLFRDILVFFTPSLMFAGCSRFHERPAVIWAFKSSVHSPLTHSFSLCLPSRQTPFQQWSSIYHWPYSAWLRALGLWRHSVSSMFN